jgi:hypothetical protein
MVVPGAGGSVRVTLDYLGEPRREEHAQPLPGGYVVRTYTEQQFQYVLTLTSWEWTLKLPEYEPGYLPRSPYRVFLPPPMKFTLRGEVQSLDPSRVYR